MQMLMRLEKTDIGKDEAVHVGHRNG
jgi:hypothetical protein